MSSRARSGALWAPACQTWLPRTLRAAPRTICVAVWFLIRASRRSASITQATRVFRSGAASPRTKWSAEGPLPLVLVHAKLGRRQVPRDVDLLRGFRGGRSVVAGRHPRIEVIRDFDGHVREFAHDVGIQAMAII